MKTLSVDKDQISSFFANAYDVWVGQINLDIFEILKDEDDKMQKRLKKRIALASLEDVENLSVPALDFLQQQQYHFFFSCAFLQLGTGLKKQNVIGVSFIWADVDKVDKEELEDRLKTVPLYPTGVVNSGHGYQLYWKLSELCTDVKLIEAAGKRVQSWVGGDNVFNVNRLMRVPGTWNCKNWVGAPTPCNLESWNKSRVFAVEEILQQPISFREINLPHDFKTKYILKGELLENFPNSRSERDFAVVKELLKTQHPDEAIKQIMMNPDFGVSSKAVEKGIQYVEITLSKAKSELGDQSLSVYDDGRVVWKKHVASNGMVLTTQLSNYAVLPKKIIRVVETDEIRMEVLVQCGRRNRVITVSAFDLTSWPRLEEKTGLPGLSWVGSNTDFKSYIGFLATKDVPEERATEMIGWVGNTFVLPTQTWFGDPICYLPTGAAPQITISQDPFDFDKFMSELYDYMLKLHKAHIVLPTLGWYLASVHAPAIRQKYYSQFPLLCLHGAPTTGKTTLSQELARALFGITTYYSVGASRAILERALSGVNALPIIIDEYVHNNLPDVNKLNTILRLSYQAGFSPKWNLKKEKADERKLVAPIAVTGPTGFEDDALSDRTVNVRVTPFDRASGREALKWLRSVPMGAPLKPWLHHRDWIDSIDEVRDMVEASDRQQHAFAIMAAPLLYAAKRWKWDLWPETLKGIWIEQAAQVDYESPFDCLDVLLAFLCRTNKLLENVNCRVVGKSLQVHTGSLVDSILLNARDLDLPTVVTRKWLIRTLNDAVDAGIVLNRAVSTRIGNKVVSATIFALPMLPRTQVELSSS